LQRTLSKGVLVERGRDLKQSAGKLRNVDLLVVVGALLLLDGLEHARVEARTDGLQQQQHLVFGDTPAPAVVVGRENRTQRSGARGDGKWAAERTHAILCSRDASAEFGRRHADGESEGRDELRSRARRDFVRFRGGLAQPLCSRGG
jgi:hypothetical protein